MAAAHGAIGMNQRRAGAVLSFVSLAVNAIISFIYVPLLLGFLTQSEYGVYQLIGSIIAYLSVMDMGLATTLSRFYVRTKGTEDSHAIENLLAMAAVIYAAITVLAIIAGGVFDASLPMLFGNSFSEAEIDLAHRMMLLVQLNSAIVLPGNWFLAVINANERFVFARSMRILKYILQLIVVYLILNWRSGAEYVLVAQVAVNAAVVASYIIYCVRSLRVSVRFHRWDLPLILSLFAFAGYILLNMVFDQVFWKTGQLVLGAVVGTGAVAVYGVATQLITSGYMQVSTGITSVFLPKLTAMASATDDMSEINDLFRRIGHLQALLVWGVCGGFIALGEDFLVAWAGLDYLEAYLPIVLLMLGLSISLVQNLGISVLQAKNMQGFRAVLYIIIALLDLLISIPVSREFGVVGCAATAAVFLFLGTGPIMNWYYHRKVGIDIPSFWKHVLPVALLSAIAAAATMLVSAPLDLPASYGSVLARAAFFIAIYFALGWALFFSPYEKSIVTSILRRSRG